METYQKCIKMRDVGHLSSANGIKTHFSLPRLQLIISFFAGIVVYFRLIQAFGSLSMYTHNACPETFIIFFSKVIDVCICLKTKQRTKCELFLFPSISILQHLCSQASEQSSNVAQEYKWLRCDLYLFMTPNYCIFPRFFLLS